MKICIIINLIHRICRARDYTCKEAVMDDYFAVIAVGGDGTINEVGSSLVNTKTALGIIHSGFRQRIFISYRDQKKYYHCHTNTEYLSLGTYRYRCCKWTILSNVAGLGLNTTVAYRTKLNSRRGALFHISLIPKRKPEF